MILFPNKKYQIIYADPPWQYWEGGKKNQSRHYSTMTVEEICNLPRIELFARQSVAGWDSWGDEI